MIPVAVPANTLFKNIFGVNFLPFSHPLSNDYYFAPKFLLYYEPVALRNHGKELLLHILPLREMAPLM